MVFKSYLSGSNFKLTIMIIQIWLLKSWDIYFFKQGIIWWDKIRLKLIQNLKNTTDYRSKSINFFQVDFYLKEIVFLFLYVYKSIQQALIECANVLAPPSVEKHGHAVCLEWYKEKWRFVSIEKVHWGYHSPSHHGWLHLPSEKYYNNLSY